MNSHSYMCVILENDSVKAYQSCTVEAQGAFVCVCELMYTCEVNNVKTKARSLTGLNRFTSIASSDPQQFTFTADLTQYNEPNIYKNKTCRNSK